MRTALVLGVVLAFVPTPAAQTNWWACTADEIYTGPVALDHAGFSLATNGDWTGDGVNDLLVGATYPWEPGQVNPDRGFVMLYHAAGDGCQESDYVFRLRGDQQGVPLQGEAFGISVAFVGNIDGDTHPVSGNPRHDFVVGSPRAPFNTTSNTWDRERGWLYVFLTSYYTPSGSEESAAAKATMIIKGFEAPVGDRVGDRFGNSVAGSSTFDWDGDLVPDILVGAPGRRYSPDGYHGKVTVISGKWVKDEVAAYVAGGGTLPLIVNVKDVPCSPVQRKWEFPGLGLSGATKWDRFGYRVALAGEVGSSTYPDFVVGAPQFLIHPPGGALGDLTKYYGPGYVSIITQPLVPGCSDPAPPADYYRTFKGGDFGALYDDTNNNWGDAFGHAVAGGIRLDADTLDDILVGAPYWDEPIIPLRDAGKAWGLTPLSTTQILARVGPNAGEQFGWFVAAMGALDADSTHHYGVGSYLAGAHEQTGGCPANCPPGDANPGGMGCGAAYFFKGSATSPHLIIRGENGRDSAGMVIARLEDTGDVGALPEIVITTARWGKDNEPQDYRERGRVYEFQR